MSKDKVNWKLRYKETAQALAALKRAALIQGTQDHLIELERTKIREAAVSLSQEADKARAMGKTLQTTVLDALKGMATQSDTLGTLANSLATDQFGNKGSADAVKEALMTIGVLTEERDQATAQVEDLTEALREETRARVTLSVELKDLYRKGVLGTDTAKILNRHFGSALRASNRHLQALWPSTETQEGLRHLFNWAKGALARQADHEKGLSEEETTT